MSRYTSSMYTQQEIQIIGLVAAGKTNQEIAKELYITSNTVKTHRRNVLQKSTARNFFQLIAHCIRNGLIE